MGKLWSIIEDWRDAMEFPPSYRQIALRLKVSQSTFDTWKNPERMPEARNLYAIHELTTKPFVDVVQAAIDDTELFDVKKAEAALIRHRQYEQEAAVVRKQAEEEGRQAALEFARRREAKLSEVDESVKPAADDVIPDVDESPGGSDSNA